MEFDEYLNPIPLNQPQNTPPAPTPPQNEEKFLTKPIEPMKQPEASGPSVRESVKVQNKSSLPMWLMFIITISSLALLAFNQWQIDFSKGFDGTRSITVVGEGIAYAVPDVAKINFGVRTENRSLAASQKENADTIADIKNELTNLDITANDIQSINYTVNPNYNPRYITRSVLTGYTTYHFLQLTANKLELVDAIIQALGDMGATDISQVTFTINDPSDVKNEAREKALAEAQDIAEQLTGLSGATLGEILEINEEVGTPNNNPFKVFGVGGAGEPNIDAGMFSAKSKITITYQLE
ncbi:MAG: SIMPL domain-containing protein [Patescibacteria group bacterium]|nr:SIMPL domain-containing protein [Patescibacteria group bacterium]